MKGFVVYHIPSGLFYHPFKGLVYLDKAHVSDTPRDFDGSKEYVSMSFDNAQNNAGQMHFAPANFNEELYAAMNNGNGDKGDKPAPVSTGDTEYRFIHYRAIRDALPHELEIHPTKEMYVDSRAGATVCFVPPTAESPIVYTTAYCSPKDNYSKAAGRLKSQAWFKANPENPARPDRGPQIAKFNDVKEFIKIIDAEMEQWGYVRLMNKKRSKKAKQGTLMLPSPETAVTDTGVQPGDASGLDDFPNYAAGETKAA